MKLLRLIWRNLIRNRRNLMFSSVGLVVGISTFVFFVALGNGVKSVVLERIFQIRQIEVVPRSFELGLTRSSAGPLDTEAVEALRGIPGVRQVYPKMKFTFPAWVTGGEELLGKRMRAEAIADGLPSAVVREDLREPERFRDWEGEFSCVGEGVGEAVGCPASQRCIAGQCSKIPCNPEVEARYNPCQGETYCVAETGVCEMPIPAIANPALLDIYNSSLTTAISGGQGVSLPQLTEEVLIGLTFDAELGKSYLGQAAVGEPIKRRVQIVGFSDKAIQLGFTIPIQYVKRFNARFSGEELRDEYHSVIVEAESNDRVAAITKAVTDMGYELDAKHAQAERLGLVINIVTVIFTLISLLIVIISAINIAQTFFMIIAERRREIGIMRALGANRWHIRSLILGEAVLLGVIGGALGVAAGVGFARFVDYLSARYVPDFPFKPESFFVFETSVQVAAVGASVLFCLMGAFLPARKAANMEPARAFSAQ